MTTRVSPVLGKCSFACESTVRLGSCNDDTRRQCGVLRRVYLVQQCAVAGVSAAVGTVDVSVVSPMWVREFKTYTKGLCFLLCNVYVWGITLLRGSR